MLAARARVRACADVVDEDGRECDAPNEEQPSALFRSGCLLLTRGGGALAPRQLQPRTLSQHGALAREQDEQPADDGHRLEEELEVALLRVEKRVDAGPDEQDPAALRTQDEVTARAGAEERCVLTRTTRFADLNELQRE
eukprot:661654-Pleurochrysis_carterae.AAC.1